MLTKFETKSARVKGSGENRGWGLGGWVSARRCAGAREAERGPPSEPGGRGEEGGSAWRPFCGPVSPERPRDAVDLWRRPHGRRPRRAAPGAFRSLFSWGHCPRLCPVPGSCDLLAF